MDAPNCTLNSIFNVFCQPLSYSAPVIVQRKSACPSFDVSLHGYKTCGVCLAAWMQSIACGNYRACVGCSTSLCACSAAWVQMVAWRGNYYFCSRLPSLLCSFFSFLLVSTIVSLSCFSYCSVVLGENNRDKRTRKGKKIKNTRQASTYSYGLSNAADYISIYIRRPCIARRTKSN